MATTQETLTQNQQEKVTEFVDELLVKYFPNENDRVKYSAKQDCMVYTKKAQEVFDNLYSQIETIILNP